jgi:uncharacterized protein YaiL (DUF2058 family)
MSLSLREQLLAAGLVSKKQVDQVEKEQSQQQHKHKKATGKAPPPKQPTAAERAAAEKAARDKELNKKKEEKAARRARAVAINQLVEQSRIPRVEDEDAEFYNFVDAGKIQRIAVKGDTRERIVSGSLVVARYRGWFALVTNEAAEKIRAIDPNAVLDYKADDKKADDNDPYKDFVVPDDLKW